MHRVVGAALLAVIDDVEAAFDLLPHDISHRLGDGGAQFGAARARVLVFGSSSSTTLAVRGRLPVWVVRMRLVLRCMSGSA